MLEGPDDDHEDDGTDERRVTMMLKAQKSVDGYDRHWAEDRPDEIGERGWTVGEPWPEGGQEIDEDWT